MTSSKLSGIPQNFSNEVFGTTTFGKKAKEDIFSTLGR
jgi:hypothetical protein